MVVVFGCRPRASFMSSAVEHAQPMRNFSLSLSLSLSLFFFFFFFFFFSRHCVPDNARTPRTRGAAARQSAMSAISLVNPHAESIRRAQALLMNMNASKGLADVRDRERGESESERW